MKILKNTIIFLVLVTTIFLVIVQFDKTSSCVDMGICEKGEFLRINGVLTEITEESCTINDGKWANNYCTFLN